MRCRLAYGPADTTASHFLLLQKIQIGFTFLVLAHPGSPGQRAIKRVRVCVCGGSRKDGVTWRFSGLSQCLQCRVIVLAGSFLPLSTYSHPCDFSALTLLVERQEEHPACKN